MLIGRPIVILYFLARKITAVKFPVGLQYPPISGSSGIVKSLDSGFRYLSSYVLLKSAPQVATLQHDRIFYEA
jgi:hypothetical protein